MDYHKPPYVEWSPDELSKQLRELGVNSRSEANRVTIEIEIPEGDSWKNESLRSPATSSSEAEARDVVGGTLDESLPIRSGVFHLDIVYLPDSFIRNVRIKRDRMIGVKYFSLFNKEVNLVLTRQGFLAVTPEVQASIARQYCRDLHSIEAIETEIANHRAAKEKFVESQKFEEAASAMHNEIIACAQLDRLVRGHVNNSLSSSS